MFFHRHAAFGRIFANGLDEILATKHLQGGAAMARFFNWGSFVPAATFGYAQFETSARAQILAAGIKEYTRRPTGGGIVLHKDDLTFSLFFTRQNSDRPADIYAGLHRTIKEEFVKRGLALGVYNKASDYRPAPGGVSSDCFTNPVSDDLLGADGQKVLGGAIRRFGDTVFYQGSLQLPLARGNKDYKEALTAAILKYFNAGHAREHVSNTVLNEVYTLAQNTYKTKQWLEKF